MTENVDLSQDDASGTAWYALTPEDVAKRLDVDPAQRHLRRRKPRSC